MSEADKLLSAIGAAGKMSIDTFNDLFISLYYEQMDEGFDEEDFKWPIIRLLDSLGYIEFDFEKREIFPCPPSIVLLPGGGLRRAVLTGVRSQLLIKKINDYKSLHEKNINVIQKSQEAKIYSYIKERSVSFSFPSTIAFEYFDEDFIMELTNEIEVQSNIKVPASWALAEYSIGLSEYREKIVRDMTKDDEVNWRKRYFNPEKFVFNKIPQKERGVCQLIEYLDPITKQKECWLWESDTAAVVDRDWGRYDVLSRISASVFLYDSHHHCLAVPSFLPLPRLLSRAVAMCSGQVPITDKLRGKRIGSLLEGTRVNIYSGVPPEYALVISSKVLQELIECTIEIGDSGVRIS